MAKPTAQQRIHRVLIDRGITREMVENRVSERLVGGRMPSVVLQSLGGQYGSAIVAAMLELVAERTPLPRP